MISLMAVSPNTVPRLFAGVLSMEFLIRGAVNFKEPGLFIAFEETEKELTQNIVSLGFDVQDLISRNMLVLDHIPVDRTEFVEGGSYNLEGLFIRLNYTIEKYKIKRVVIDTLEILFSNLANELILRTELQRLFRWLKSKEVTVIVTAEQGEKTFSRFGLEEYVADCVVLLDNRMDAQISTRRLRIAKYRGSAHGCNEYPFIINEHGFSITAITSIKLNYKVSRQRITSGIKQLDVMLGGKGFYRSSSILLAGPAGTGKSSFAAAFANGTCENKEKCLYFGFEESVDQIVRNMQSINIPLLKWINKGLLKFHNVSPNSSGLEAHFADIRKITEDFEPSVVIIDPITNLKSVGLFSEVQDVLSSLIYYFKTKGITTMFTSLISASTNIDTNSDASRMDLGISSQMDTWIYLQNILAEGERNRGISIMKSRGMLHSNQLREVIISSKGINLQEVYIGSDKVLVGSARLIQANKLEIENAARDAEIKHADRELKNKHKGLETKIESLNEMLAAATEEARYFKEQNKLNYKLIKRNSDEVAKMRMADVTDKKIRTKKIFPKRVKPSSKIK
jgi:circadian clock protein KaiC